MVYLTFNAIAAGGWRFLILGLPVILGKVHIMFLRRFGVILANYSFMEMMEFVIDVPFLCYRCCRLDLSKGDLRSIN